MQTQIVKKIGVFIGLAFLVVSMSLPILTYSAQNQLAGTISGLTYECTGGAAGECTFADLMAAVKNVVNKGTIIALALTVVVIAYAGGKYMMSGGNAGKRKEANEMLRKVAIGIVFILAAWMIVTLITNALVTSAVKQVLPF